MSKPKKKAPKKTAKAHAGAMTCHITKKGKGLALKCPNVKAIKLVAAPIGVKFAAKGVAKAAKAATTGGTVVASSSGKAVVSYAPVDYKSAKTGSASYPFAS